MGRRRLVSRCVLVLAASTGCFSPDIPSGLLCGPGGQCPEGFLCSSGTCVDERSDVDSDGGLPVDDGGNLIIPDAMPDERCLMWEEPRPLHFDPCAIPFGTENLNLGTGITHQLDTDTAILNSGGLTRSLPIAAVVQTGGVTALVVSVAEFSLGPSDILRVTGSRPLILASWSTMEIDGVILVNSTTSSVGAGASPAVCGATLPPTGSVGGAGGASGGGGEGGGGGGYGGTGKETAQPNIGGAGGSGLATSAIVRGGCRGGSGQAGGGAAAVGGHGGGAIQLTARVSIKVDGKIHAGGAGGSGGIADGGGGGGGSGGYIGIDAPDVAGGPTALVAANGGGGGSGADLGGNGSVGGNGVLGVDRTAGGVGGGGGSGGLGGALGGAAVDGAAGGTGGAGGGGGAVGVIQVRGTLIYEPGATASPLIVTLP